MSVRWRTRKPGLRAPGVGPDEIAEGIQLAGNSESGGRKSLVNTLLSPTAFRRLMGVSLKK